MASGIQHYCDFESLARGGYNSSSTSIDGLSSHGDLSSSSPIDLICNHVAARSSSSDDEPSPLGWPLARQHRSQLRMSPATPRAQGLNFGERIVMPSSPTSAGSSSNMWDDKPRKKQASELEMMKERFSKLLLGEDMSGSGKGVCTALAISNAITNLAASVFGELWKLEPLSVERKAMWNREMDWLLSVCDHIVEFVPSFHSVSDGSSLEVMISRPRSDLHINLPALRKLDAMLLEALDSFKETEFWYVDQGVSVVENSANHTREPEATTAGKRQEEKWWLPVPKIPAVGLSEKSRKALQYQRDCTSQILKAAMAINEQVLSEMQVPEVYWDSLPKSGRSSLGERIYHGLGVEHFSPDSLLSSLDLSTEHNALEVANRIQSAVHVWRKKVPTTSYKAVTSPRHHAKDSCGGGKATSSRYPWSKVKELVAECDNDKRIVLIERAESLLLCLRQRFPGLPQTVLDVNKIQFNKDVGQAILESYSRVLESLAFSILSRIDDVLYIADMTKRNAQQQQGQQEQQEQQQQAASLRQGSRKLAPPSLSTPFVTPYASPGSDSSSPSLSPRQRQPNSPEEPTIAAPPVTAETAAATTTTNSVCPSFLGSLCNVVEDVREVKKPVTTKERPWLDMRSFYSPPGRD